MRIRKIDLDYLVRYTNAPWLVIQDKGAADDGLFARDKKGNPLAFDKKKKKLVNATAPDIVPALVGEFKLADGRKAVPVAETSRRPVPFQGVCPRHGGGRNRCFRRHDPAHCRGTGPCGI